MRDSLMESKPEGSVPVIPVAQSAYEEWLGRQGGELRSWLNTCSFKAKPNSFCLVPRRDGKLASVIAGVSSSEDPWALANMPVSLPEGAFYIKADWNAQQLERVSLGWGLGAYQFSRYKKAERAVAKLVIDPACNANSIQSQLKALYMVRDLINTPPEDMMPEQLADVVREVGEQFGAQVSQIAGDALLEENYPAIHAVGRASGHEPCLIDLRWGDETHPKLTLVGKGVCFDSGGLNLKQASAMRLMKKDMGGAAHAIGLAQLIMGAGLPVRLRVLVPAVENAVSENALRPGDIIRSRKGLTIEIDNTDAEGRLILCDALAEGANDNPDLMIDFATLTGAARVAMGTDIPAFFCNSDDIASGLEEASREERDPIWRLPLYEPYRELLDSEVADMANSSKEPFAGAITAALFLKEFVSGKTLWVHFDLMAWNGRSRPGRPEGGEAMGLRACLSYLRRLYGA